MFIPPKKETRNNIPSDAGHFLRTEIDLTEFKKENLAFKSIKKKVENEIFIKQKR